MKIYITGVQGFLGGAIAKHFAQRGYRVLGSSRSPSYNGFGLLERIDFFDLVTPNSVPDFSGCDVIIHCAHHFGNNQVEVNYSGTKVLLTAGERAGVKRQLYLSSFAAHAEARSEYGKTKFTLEKEFQVRGHVIIRPGLVIGPGGLFARSVTTLSRFPVLPLIDGGRDPIPLITIRDFLEALDGLLEKSEGENHNWFYEPMVSFRELVTLIKRASGGRVLYLPIPFRAALAVLDFADRLPVRLPVSRENLLGLKQNASSPHRSTLVGHRDPVSLIESAVHNVLLNLYSGEI